MLTIATINVQNKYQLKRYDGLYKNEDHVKMLLELILQYHLDIVGLQEVNPRYFERLSQLLYKNFTCYGESRYPKNLLTNHIGVLTTFNESVPIITRLKVLSKKTKLLPWISSMVPRIVTIMELSTREFGKVVVLNTHLDHRKNKTKVKELQYLLQLIRKIGVPVILMGDFNMTNKNDDFRKFVTELQTLGIFHVDVLEKTFKEATTNRAIDHIFLSQVFEVEQVIIEKSQKYQNFSDHYPVILKLRLGFPKK